MIFSLDCATKTGWCLWQDGQVVFAGTQDFSKKRGESNGLMFLRFDKWLRETADAAPHPVKLLAYERAHHRGGAATEICVNMTGRVQQLAASLGVEVATVPTGTLKKFATGAGNAGKDQMIQVAQGLKGGPVVDDNEADAILIAAYAADQYGEL